MRRTDGVVLSAGAAVLPVLADVDEAGMTPRPPKPTVISYMDVGNDVPGGGAA